jgi:hypothetical protein
MLNDFYVYVLFDAFGVPRYVGKGRRNRWLMHERSSDPKEFIERTWLMLGEIPKIKVRENLYEADAYETEIALIAAIGRSPHGPLVNMTNGGEGGNLTPEEHLKISIKGAAAAAKSPRAIAARRENMRQLNARMTPEQRSAKARPGGLTVSNRTPAQLQAIGKLISVGQRASWADPDKRAARLAKLKLARPDYYK